MSKLRYAEVEDLSAVLSLIKALAEYEKMSGDVVATEELLNEWLFENKIARVLLATLPASCGEGGLAGREGERIVGFALYFYNFSTFVGRGGIYLEDLFVLPEFRGRGFGKALFKALATEATQRQLGRIEWSCLDWNQPSIDFYLSLGAKAMDEWTTYRLTREKIALLAGK